MFFALLHRHFGLRWASSRENGRMEPIRITRERARAVARKRLLICIHEAFSLRRGETLFDGAHLHKVAEVWEHGQGKHWADAIFAAEETAVTLGLEIATNALPIFDRPIAWLNGRTPYLHEWAAGGRIAMIASFAGVEIHPNAYDVLRSPETEPVPLKPGASAVERKNFDYLSDIFRKREVLNWELASVAQVEVLLASFTYGYSPDPKLEWMTGHAFVLVRKNGQLMEIDELIQMQDPDGRPCGLWRPTPTSTRELRDRMVTQHLGSDPHGIGSLFIVELDAVLSEIEAAEEASRRFDKKNKPATAPSEPVAPSKPSA